MVQKYQKLDFNWKALHSQERVNGKETNFRQT